MNKLNGNRDQQDHRMFDPITVSCYTKKVRDGEQFIPDHVFSYQISGKLTLWGHRSQHTFTKGSFRLTRRNSLLKFLKDPNPDGEYKNLSVFLDQQILREVAQEYHFEKSENFDGAPVIGLPRHDLLENYIRSLSPYDRFAGHHNDPLLKIKVKELILILIRLMPALKCVLFNFSTPGKVDIAAFMNQNFMFNLSLERFAYLTGRSLSTFKRDFKKVFLCRPGQWLQEKRLQQAYYLISKKGRTPSEAYIDAGFENLSHFSSLFKKAYRINPSELAKPKHR